MDHHQNHAHRAVSAAPEPASFHTEGLSPPHEDEDHRLAGAVVFKAEIKTDGTDCASADQVLQPPPSKFETTLQARLAMAGWTLTRVEQEDGAHTFLASRWNRARELPDLAAVTTFADQVGAPS